MHLVGGVQALQAPVTRAVTPSVNREEVTLQDQAEIGIGSAEWTPSRPAQPSGVPQHDAAWEAPADPQNLPQVVQSQAAEIERLKALLAASEQKLSRAHYEVDALTNIGQACSQTEDPKQLLGRILEESINLVGAQKGSLLLYNPKTDSLQVQVLRGVPPDVQESVESGRTKCLEFKPGEGVAGQAFASKQPVIVNDAHHDARFTQPGKSFTSDVLCVPLMMPDGSCLGVLNMTNKVDGKQFGPEDAERMKAVSGTAAMGIANAQKTERLRTDHLTGVASRQALEQYLDDQLKTRGENGLSVLFVDLNDFKSVNTDHGHEAGDLVLRQVASQLKSAVGDQGMVGRFGGDEFAVVVPKSGALLARGIADQMKLGVNRSPVEYEGQSIQPSISVGVRSFEGQDANVDARQLFRDADKGMYREKQQFHQQALLEQEYIIR